MDRIALPCCDEWREIALTRESLLPLVAADPSTFFILYFSILYFVFFYFVFCIFAAPFCSLFKHFLHLVQNVKLPNTKVCAVRLYTFSGASSLKAFDNVAKCFWSESVLGGYTPHAYFPRNFQSNIFVSSVCHELPQYFLAHTS